MLRFLTSCALLLQMLLHSLFGCACHEGHYAADGAACRHAGWEMVAKGSQAEPAPGSRAGLCGTADGHAGHAHAHPGEPAETGAGRCHSPEAVAAADRQPVESPAAPRSECEGETCQFLAAPGMDCPHPGQSGATWMTAADIAQLLQTSGASCGADWQRRTGLRPVCESLQGRAQLQVWLI